MEHIAREISSRENFYQIDFYSTVEAQKANSSASYLKEHPNAIKEGYLGNWDGEKFNMPVK